MGSEGKGQTRRQFVSQAAGASLGALASGSAAWQTLAQAVGTEADRGTTQARYLSKWPLPPRSSVPAWALPGRVRFARWDGGSLEVAKAILSGWPEFNPAQPQHIEAMAGWYDLRTIQFLRDAHINTIWVTFSNGFSNETEHPQQEKLREYIEACHGYGIHVIAYESLTNMFFEDVFANVPEAKSWLSRDKQGNPITYGAADYKKAGHVSRYLADLSHPGWLSYVRGRLDLAIDAGADGVMYDNCFGAGLAEVFHGLVEHALDRKKDFLMMANFHHEQFIYNRMLNAITTEEGSEAGVFSEEEIQTANNRWQRERETMLAVDGGYVSNNLGRLRVFANLSEGWKPFMIETRIRKYPGMAESHVMSPEHQQLGMAENMVFNCAFEPSVEISLAHGLWNKLPEAEAAWSAIAAYNAFAMANEAYYVGAEPLASIAIVLDNRTEGMALLNGLAGRNLQYEIVYQDQLTPQMLRRFKAVAAFTAVMVGNAALAALEGFVRGGGKLFVAQGFATQDAAGTKVIPPAWIDAETRSGRIVRWDGLPSTTALAAQLAAAAGAQTMRVTVPPHVLYSVMHQPAEKRILVHLMNYKPRSAAACSIEVQGVAPNVKVMSPDPARPKYALRKLDGGRTRLELETVEIYSVVVLEGAA